MDHFTVEHSSHSRVEPPPQHTGRYCPWPSGVANLTTGFKLREGRRLPFRALDKATMLCGTFPSTRRQKLSRNTTISAFFLTAAVCVPSLCVRARAQKHAQVRAQQSKATKNKKPCTTYRMLSSKNIFPKDWQFRASNTEPTSTHLTSEARPAHAHCTSRTSPTPR